MWQGRQTQIYSLMKEIIGSQERTTRNTEKNGREREIVRVSMDNAINRSEETISSFLHGGRAMANTTRWARHVTERGVWVRSRGSWHPICGRQYSTFRYSASRGNGRPFVQLFRRNRSSSLLPINTRPPATNCCLSCMYSTRHGQSPCLS